MIDDIITKLVQEGVGIAGDNLFAGELPLNSKDCLAVIYAPSPEPHMTFDIYEQDFDFWSRFKDSRTAYDTLEDVKDIFHRVYHYDLANEHVYFSWMAGTIQDMDRDLERRKLYKLTIRFIYRPLN